MLSNFWEPPGKDDTKALFHLGGHKWRTLQNYLQGIKYIKENHNYYLQFSLDSNSKISKSPILAKKTNKSNNNQVEASTPKKNKTTKNNNQTSKQTHET